MHLTLLANSVGSCHIDAAAPEVCVLENPSYLIWNKRENTHSSDVYSSHPTGQANVPEQKSRLELCTLWVQEGTHRWCTVWQHREPGTRKHLEQVKSKPAASAKNDTHRDQHSEGSDGRRKCPDVTSETSAELACGKSLSKPQ